MTTEFVIDRYLEEICGTQAFLENIIIDQKTMTKAQIIEKVKFIDHFLEERRNDILKGKI